MKISIGCIQRFDVTVTREVIDVLILLGRAHYDGVCKGAVYEGGFIYGWDQRMQFGEEDGKESSFVESITNRELQTCLKICENSRSLLTQSQRVVHQAIVSMGYEALSQARSDWRFGISVPVPSGSDPREVEIAKLREENSRLYMQAVALLHFVPGETKCGDIQEIRGRYEAWLLRSAQPPLLNHDQSVMFLEDAERWAFFRKHHMSDYQGKRLHAWLIDNTVRADGIDGAMDEVMAACSGATKCEGQP